MAGREVSPLPRIANRSRRRRSLASLRVFCEVYGPKVFYSAWSPAHIKAIAKLEHAIKSGGKFALAWPRGRGKTALFIFAILWAVLSGRRKFVFVLAASQPKATKIVAALTKLLTKNRILKADFPEATHVLWRLEGVHQRKLLWKGAPITYSLEAGRIVIPAIPRSVCSQSIIEAAGLESAVRGTFEMSDEGEHRRPDLLLIDDPQTKESAKSPTQVQTRWELLKEAVMGMSGTGKTLAAIAAVTVIAEDDLAEKLLDHKLSPEWRGELFPLMPKMPESELWDEYARLRAESLVQRGDLDLATDFYVKNRAVMDEGAEVMWLSDYKPDLGEVSAIQSAMNLFFEDAVTFWAEMNQNPKGAQHTDEDALTAVGVQHQLNHLPQYVVPTGSTLLTSFIDFQKSLFFYGVIAWREGFGGDVIDYGSFPKQSRTYFTKRDASKRFEHLTIDGVKLKSLSQEERWSKALRAFTAELLSKEYPREDGGTALIQRCLIDAQYGESTETIYRFLKSSPAHQRSLLIPSHGDPISPTSTPFNERKQKEGERKGDHYVIGLGERRQLRVRYDANYWKLFVRNRFNTDVAARGALRLWGSDPHRHEMFANHMLSEKPIMIEARGRKMVLFSKPDGDNEYLDIASGNCIAAASLGLTLDQVMPKKAKKKRGRVTALKM